LIRHRPSLVAELLGAVFTLKLPAHHSVRVDAGALTDLVPTEYRADVVVVLADGDDPVAAVVVEVQLGRDKDKRWSWPVYLATLRARWECPTLLLVFCVESGVAAWCAAPIELGHPGFALAPLVLGPDRMPIVVERAEAARSPELAVLSAMAHGGGPDQVAVLDALEAALDAVDAHHALLYLDVVLGALPDAARGYLEALMASGTYEYQSDFARRYYGQGWAEGQAEGRARGEANAVLSVLDARGIDVSDADRQRITGCTDLGQLEVWVRRAVTAESVRDLFS
jgi:hypothetical protein